MEPSSKASEAVAAVDSRPVESATTTTSKPLQPVVAPTENMTVVKSEAPADEMMSDRPVSPPPSGAAVAEVSQVATPQPIASVSDGLARDQSAEASATDAPIYGTRSRNRTGNARPNYAEDQEMDFEYTAPAKSDSKRTQPVVETKRTQDTSTTTKFIAVNGQGQSEKLAAKDPIPGTSTFSANPTKKRKAVVAATAASTPPAAATTSATLTSSRRSAPSSITNGARESNVMTFTKSKSRLSNGALVADDGTTLNVNDHVYLVCEPPGDPYYLCRIMEFLHTNSDDPWSPVDSMRVNWFYRPRDVQRYNNDTRLVYGTMHSDLCPLTSLRGKCKVMHRSEIDSIDEYRKGKDCFWFSQIIDRFIKRFYEVIPTSQVINVPEKVKKALDERWKFIAVEISRVKELTSAVKLCKRCSGYCASHDSVECAICGNTYHMNCVRPPLPKKPSRGFAWACGPCGRAQEQKLEARSTPTLGQDAIIPEEELMEEEEEDPNNAGNTRAPSPSSDIAIDQHPGTQAEIALAKMWPMRYLGIHCRVEDALQYDDRAIYPRASSRLGPRHQANVNIWHGRPVELIKPADIKKRYIKNTSHKKDAKLSKETMAALEADRVERAKRPKWVHDEPAGYVHRGEDFDNDDPRCTAKVVFKMPAKESPLVTAASIEEYLSKARKLCKDLKVAQHSINFTDKILSLLYEAKYNHNEALKKVAKLDRVKDLKEPILTAEELKKFEEGAAKYGSEHRLIKQHMKTSLPISTIIRFYYLWKKTPRGKQIWDNFGGRKSTKKRQQNMDTATKFQAEVVDDGDDSAFDNTKAATHKRGFQCKFCSTIHSRVWKRAPGVSPGQTAPLDKSLKEKSQRLMLALCLRCAGLWRKYAIQWEDVDEVAKKVAQGGGKVFKRRIDEELLRELMVANEATSRSTPDTATPSIEGAEPPRKKTKTGAEVKKPVPPPKLPTPPPPPIIPDQPKRRILPCAVCKTLDEAGVPPICCTSCKLSVHMQCYGVPDQAASSKWVCDQCTNDRNPVVSTEYECVLCPQSSTEQDLWEPPKVSHKKKTDRDREKERLEKDLIDKARNEYVSRQLELSRPVQPREPFKRTDGNNWVHVACAVWTPEIKFSNAGALEKAEGFSTIPMSKYDASCKICKDVGGKQGACASCLQCHAAFHVSCALEQGYIFGFDVTPVKGSRKDQITTVTLGEETGYLTAAIWCKDHTVKSIVHPMNEIVDDTGKTALQLFVEYYKQADQTLTGTARKANLLTQSTRLAPGQVAAAAAAVAANRRFSTVSNATTGRKARNSSAGLPAKDEEVDAESPVTRLETEGIVRSCVTCGIDVSPRWWPAEKRPPTPERQRVDVVREVPAEDTGGPGGPVQDEGTKVETAGEAAVVLLSLEASDQEPSQHQCHKCHWRKLNEPTPPPEIKQQPVQSPPRQHLPPLPPPPPPPTTMDWTGQPGGLHQAHFGQPHGPPRASQEPLSYGGPPLASPGSHFPPHGMAPVYGPPPPLYQQPNGMLYGHHAAAPQSYAPPHGHVHHHRPPPLSNLPSGPPLPNGVHSPGYPQHSPPFAASHAPPQTYPGPPRMSESSFPPPIQANTMHGAAAAAPANRSPAQTFAAAPTTPRDGSIDPRLGGGASASPSLRNLLH